jgi:hypothetical protein
VTSPLVVMFVPGVTPGKWERIWRDRMPRDPLELRPASETEALAALRGPAHMAFLRDVPASDDLHVIPLYREQPVAVVQRDSLLSEFASLTLADLAGFTPADSVDLVAAAGGYLVVPQSVARAASRKDVVARPVVDAPDTGIGLAWPTSAQHPLVETFIGIVRGRTPNSSRQG